MVETATSEFWRIIQIQCFCFLQLLSITSAFSLVWPRRGGISCKSISTCPRRYWEQYWRPCRPNSRHYPKQSAYFGAAFAAQVRKKHRLHHRQGMSSVWRCVVWGQVFRPRLLGQYTKQVLKKKIKQTQVITNILDGWPQTYLQTAFHLACTTATLFEMIHMQLDCTAPPALQHALPVAVHWQKQSLQCEPQDYHFSSSIHLATTHRHRFLSPRTA